MSPTPYRSERMMQTDLCDFLASRGVEHFQEVELDIGRADLVIPMRGNKFLVAELKVRPRPTTLIGAVHQVMAYGFSLTQGFSKRGSDISTYPAIVVDRFPPETDAVTQYIATHTQIGQFTAAMFEDYLLDLITRGQMYPISRETEGASA